MTKRNDKPMAVELAEVRQVLESIIQWNGNPYAVSYAEVALMQCYNSTLRRDLVMQCRYIQGNLTSWRGPEARAGKVVLKEFIRQNK